MIKTIPFAIIGAGPAGLAAAIAYGSGAVIIEKQEEAGKKLLLSGSGQCNFTNTLSNEDFIRACRRAGPFLKHALYAYDHDYFIDLLAKAGCQSFAREDGKVFPISLKAEHVRDALLNLALQKGANILYDEHIKNIKPDGTGFILETDKDNYFCVKVLLACGGSSWPQTGSTGDGYTLAATLGHTISDIRSALAALDIDDSGYFTHCAGISLQDTRAEFIFPKGRQADTGDILFTHTGLSGPLILNNSYLLAKGDTVRLHLLLSAEKNVMDAIRIGAGKQISNALRSLPLPFALIEAILARLNINPETKTSALTKLQRNRIISTMQSCDFRIKAIESLQTCMSTAGGVLLKEVNSASLESRLVPGLYLAGEVLDYALPTGGFNIQAAFSTGSLAGMSAALQK